MIDNVENRLSSLEQQVRDILTRLKSKNGSHDWRESLGMFDGRPEMKKIDEAGIRIRQESRLEIADDNS